MAKIKQLKDKSGTEQIFPKTKTQAIFNEDGSLLSETLNTLNSNLHYKIVEKNVNVGSIAGNTAWTTQLDFSNDASGYTPIGFVRCQNSKGASLHITGIWWSGSSGLIFNAYNINTSSSALTDVAFYVKVIFVKSSLTL